MPERAASVNVADVFRLADTIAPRYRALVLLATSGNMRWGEFAGLRRQNLDLDEGAVRIDETVYELGPLVRGTPKSGASRRKVAIPDLIIRDLSKHLEKFAAPGRDGFVLAGVRGNRLRRSNFSKYWARALDAALPEGVHVPTYGTPATPSPPSPAHRSTHRHHTRPLTNPTIPSAPVRTS